MKMQGRSKMWTSKACNATQFRAKPMQISPKYAPYQTPSGYYSLTSSQHHPKYPFMQSSPQEDQMLAPDRAASAK